MGLVSETENIWQHHECDKRYTGLWKYDGYSVLIPLSRTTSGNRVTFSLDA